MRPFRAVLIGQNSLLLDCAKVLLERGMEIAGVVSPNPELRGRAGELGIACADHDSSMADFLSSHEPFDYLFSITNLRMLPPDILVKAGRAAINFHDAPLPRGAGTHATAWAIRDQASGHGVTWHLMVDKVDAGDIVARREVPIERSDTSYDLNVKCHRAGVESFTELVDDLLAGRMRRIAQDPAERTYHPRWARPPLTISWREPAEAIDALVRATAFGPHPNEFGVAKVLVGGQWLVVGETSLCGSSSDHPAGTVLEVAGDGIKVSTTSADLWLRRLTSCAGEPPRIASTWPGDRLVEHDHARESAITRRALRHERYWVERLRDLAPLDLPAPGETEPRAVRAPEWATQSQCPQETMLATVLAFLGRLSGGKAFDIALRHRLPDSTLLAAYVPFRAPALGEGLDEHLDGVRRELDEVRRRDTYAADVVLRYPGLRATAMPVAIDLCGGTETGPLVGIDENGTTVWRTDESFVEIFTAFAHGVAAHGPLAAPLLTDTASRAMDLRNATATEYPADRCVHQLLADQARRTPDATAVTASRHSLSYRELDTRATLLARSLAAAGAAPGTRVGVYLTRSTDLLVTLLAVMKSGAAYVPLDPIYPRERVKLMLDDAGVELVVTESTLTSDLTAGLTTVELDTLMPGLLRSPDPEPFDRACADGLAYVIYTSGSTGRPKGVCVGHRALTNFLCSMARRPGFAAGDRLLAVTTVCFDIAGLELYLPLVTGGQVEIAPAETAADGSALRELVEAAAPTVLQATPATWRMLLAAGWAGDQRLKVLCGGEAFPPDLAAALAERVGEVWNLYGPTETTIWSAVSQVRAGEPITLGTPIANTTLHVLDEWLNPVPDGVAGELHIGGHGLAHGYHDRPELTAERFRTLASGERVYRTGDLVRYSTAGVLEYLGRLDHQVKIRGFRIELGEIDACLSSHPAVAQVVTVARGQRLIAYVVPEAGRVVAADDLRELAAKTMPDYMMPSAFLSLDAFPLTPNGKVDRSALPDPVVTGTSARAPRTSLEQTLCELFRAALGVDAVGVDDHFIDLGGTSVSAAGLIGRARHNGLPVDARALFDHPTPARLAAHLDAGPSTGAPIDLHAEITLAADIVPAPEVSSLEPEPRRILLTGATGFVGAFLLRDLARIPEAAVHCLVRGRDSAGARARLAATLARYELDVDLDRVHLEVGDLAEPDLGLGPDRFDELAQEMDAVYHAGAVVNWLHSYGDLKAANVTGTEQILRLAARHRTVPVHYVSSMGVFAHRRAGSPRHRVDDPIGPAEGLLTGYQRGKWVTEHLIELARGRGLPVSVYRVARVCGDRTTGACQSDDLLWRVLKGCVEIGGVPEDTELSFDLVPVDYVAKAITELSLGHAPGTHHLSNPRLTTFSTLVESLRAAGYPLLDLDREKWCDLVDSHPENAAHTLLSAFRATAWRPELTEIALAPTGTGPACPPVDDLLLARHRQHFVRTGFLPEPEPAGVSVWVSGPVGHPSGSTARPAVMPTR